LWCLSTLALLVPEPTYDPRCQRFQSLGSLSPSAVEGFLEAAFRFNFQPSDSTPVMTMENDMVCETTEGNLEGTKDGQAFTAPKGTIWICRKGGTEMTANKGSTVVIMRVIDLLPA
jgi:hypothetical protein